MSAPQYSIKDVTGTITVYTRNHINRCTLADQNHNNCSCPKWIYANRRGHDPRRYAADTPSFTEACQIAKHTHDGWHPEIAEARAVKVKAEKQKKEIATVVNEFIDDRSATGCTLNTVANYKSVIGYVNGHTRGHFLTWLDQHNAGLSDEERVTFITQVDATILGHFKTTLMRKYSTDKSRNQGWRYVRIFFKWVFERGYVSQDVAAHIKSPAVKKGNRCGAWTDDEYVALQEAVSYYDEPRKGMLPEVRVAAKQRTALLMALMRYTGMSIVDAVLFSPVASDGLGLDDNNVLRYRRRKTNELAVVPVENAPLLAAIRKGIPLEPDSDPKRPFLPKGADISATASLMGLTRHWTNRLGRIFATAGITEVTTEVGKKAPHAQMFRDTFAKWHLSRGTDIRDLQKMMGHSSVTTTERHYSSWMTDDQQAMIDRVQSRIEGNVIRTSASTWKSTKKGVAVGA